MSKRKGKTPKYSPEFKIIVIEDMIQNKLGYGETARKYGMYSSPERAFKRNGNKIPGGVTSTIKRIFIITVVTVPKISCIKK